jgi:AcrR family transcriptional regulator
MMVRSTPGYDVDGPMTSTPDGFANHTRPPLRERKRRRTREHIVAVAYDLFGERGYAAVTVDDIVEAAEVSRSTFFRYFGDKQEVVFSQQQQIHDSVATAESTRGPADPADLHSCIAYLGEVIVRVYRELEQSPRFAVHQQLVHDNAELRDRQARKLLAYADGLSELLRSQGVEGRTAHLAAYLAAACSLAAERDPQPGLSIADEVQRCCAQLVGAPTAP